MMTKSTPTPNNRPLSDPTITPIPLRGWKRPGEPTTNWDAARMLSTVASVLELMGDNPYRVAAYRRAANLLMQTEEDLHELLQPGRHGDELMLPGLGERMRRKLADFLATGRMDFSVELRTALPEPARELLQIRSVGPRTALRLVEELGLQTVEEVADAARAGKIRRLHGFGPKREKQILDNAEAILFEPTDPDPAQSSALVHDESPVVELRSYSQQPVPLPLPDAA
jgi:DNA polymerase (family 10)